jgi:hypothetical protein
VRQQRLLKLADSLSPRAHSIVEAVGRFRLLRADQIRNLSFAEIKTEAGRARICRRTLQKLTSEGLLRQLEQRTVGGRQGGSSGHIYALAAAGRRLLALRNGEGIASNRGLHEPGLLFVRHTLAIADLYLILIDADRSGAIELLAFDVEPVRTYTSPLGGQIRVKPDALVRLGAGDYEYAAFCELDCATEGRGALQRKINAYVHLYRSGREQNEHGLFPRIVWITPTQRRASYIQALTATLPPETRRLFTSTTIDDVLPHLTSGDTAEEEAR